MKIKKILNNNAVLVGKDGKDFIWIGAGLGFKKKLGQEADETKIEKVFILHQKKAEERFLSLMESIPVEYVSLADNIILLAKNELSYELSETLYISLTDHLYNLVKLYEQGLTINNRLSWEIKKFYPKEFEVGKKALRMIEEQESLALPEEEAGNIAMHIINAQMTDELDQLGDVQLTTKKIRDIIVLIRLSSKREIDEDSLAFDRFVTHLRFFFQRLEKDSHLKVAKENVLLNHIKEQYQKVYEIMLLVEQYLQVELSDDEKVYLSLHIQKLIEND
ncbi:PRD domain-containing protein [Listeria costaricensis]|uniref:PRD domain-containing protein n=1 Tax=Listeria costaricensis TaxID=2026604 RepID=UPI001968DB8B|nr:PRD domain-containing protein [Listeria costaricensis]